MVKHAAASIEKFRRKEQGVLGNKYAVYDFVLCKDEGAYHAWSNPKILPHWPSRRMPVHLHFSSLPFLRDFRRRYCSTTRTNRRSTMSSLLPFADFRVCLGHVRSRKDQLSGGARHARIPGMRKRSVNRQLGGAGRHAHLCFKPCEASQANVTRQL